jgi:outer membrane lipoprotein SlyB
MNKFITAGIFTLMASTANAEAVNGSVQDHYKIVIEQAPYRVEVCKDVHVQGSNAGEGALGGMIIGGVLGKVLGGNDKGAAAGAILGGVIGADKAQKRPSGTRRQCQVETRYEETQRNVYSHSTVTFYSDGQQYTVKFQKRNK